MPHTCGDDPSKKVCCGCCKDCGCEDCKAVEGSCKPETCNPATCGDECCCKPDSKCRCACLTTPEGSSETRKPAEPPKMSMSASK